MKIAIITGASSGIGREFLKQIYNNYDMDYIWILGRNTKVMESIKEELDVEGKNKIIIMPIDLTVDEDLCKFREILKEKSPEVHILVNSAGIGFRGEFIDNTVDSRTKEIRLNCEALTVITHMCIPYMTNSGQIINMASSAGFLPQVKFAVYSACKAYVISFSRALAWELRYKKISVTAVCPGPVNTEFIKRSTGGKELSKIKKAFLVEPNNVVKKALKDSKKGKALSIYGLSNKLLYIVSKIIPHSLILAIESLSMKGLKQNE